jgi:hypothetical protein
MAIFEWDEHKARINLGKHGAGFRFDGASIGRGFHHAGRKHPHHLRAQGYTAGV